MLDITRIQANQLVLQRIPTDIIPIVKHVVAGLQQTTTRHQIKIHTTASQLLAIDPRRFEQVLLNLIENSIKYSPQGGPIILSIWEEAHMAYISIQDTGIGIPKDQQKQIFGRLTCARNALALSIAGTGLGLYLCHELVERHGGHLWLESEEGKGTTFFMTLPLTSDQEGAQSNSS